MLAVPDPPSTKRVARRWRNPRLLDTRPEEIMPMLRSVTPGWTVVGKVTMTGPPREAERERERIEERERERRESAHMHDLKT